MHDTKPASARATFWCGVLTAEKQVTAPTQARTVRGMYTSSSPTGLHPERKPSRKKAPAP